MPVVFSIITATFNRGYVIWKTIQSIQKQIYPEWELLIVDDGSIDNTEQVVAELQKDSRIKYFKRKHEGGSAARNYGLKQAKGKIITYIDSDDPVYENYLSVAEEYFRKYPKKVFATCNYNRRLELYENYKLVDFVNSSSAQSLDVKLQDFYHWKVRTCGTGVFHKRIVVRNGIKWDTNFRMLDDLDFILQLGRISPKGYMHIPYVLFEYTQKYGGDSICSNTSYIDQGKAFEKIYKKHKNDPLMSGQTWYPERVERYKRLQKEFEAGKIPSPVYKYFPKHFRRSVTKTRT